MRAYMYVWEGWYCVGLQNVLYWLTPVVKKDNTRRVQSEILLQQVFSHTSVELSIQI